MYATMNPVPGFPDDFVPVDPGGYRPVAPGVCAPGVPGGPPRRTPGLRESVIAWVANGVAWVSLIACGVLFLFALAESLAENDADGWVFAAVVVYAIGVIASVGAAVALGISFARRLGADELHRAGPIVDLVMLSIVTTISVATSASPLLLLV